MDGEGVTAMQNSLQNMHKAFAWWFLRKTSFSSFYLRKVLETKPYSSIIGHP